MAGAVLRINVPGELSVRTAMRPGGTYFKIKAVCVQIPSHLNQFTL